ncbi:hypothetical protein B0T10DRAFT_465776 [Thelonectria olida]|uniref:Protein kinase domain-containing protein n=1 Tax=Thelonectria olida TaxID=1576542 RepID=A0A9P8VSW8_9HYPO|nr:hypothetical protein B0T10DRAFT_465776 [Thelonectria olida]
MADLERFALSVNPRNPRVILEHSMLPQSSDFNQVEQHCQVTLSLLLCCDGHHSPDPQLGVIESHIKHPSIGFLELIGSSLRISCLLSPPDILRNQAANESLSDSRQPTAGQGETKSQRKDLMKLVANKTEIPAQIPQYDGLERWELLEKMGAGGFSTVYRAQDLDGKAGEVAD